MKMALSLGRRGLGRVWPNPAVGCVIVRDGRVIGRGWTQPGGRPHAETEALAMAGPAARGATAYVTLEPCAHHGKTAPCANALVDAGVARVVVACMDSDPRVAGQGLDILRVAGIDVTLGVCEEQARADHAGFFLKTDKGRPWVTLKLACSLDGRIATASGESQWITGPHARRRVHAERARHDAVMVGAGTARADDPSLTVRDLGISQQPVRVVVSRRLDLPLSGKLAQTATDIPVWLCHGSDVADDLVPAWRGIGAQTLECATKAGQLDPHSVLMALGAKGLTRVFCEGGGALAASLFAADLVDELQVFSAGIALGAEGWPALGALGLGRLAEAPRFALKNVEQVGADILHIWQRS